METPLSLQTRDGLTLFTRKWLSSEPSHGVIALVHGMGEHSGRYNHVAQKFTQSGYPVVGFDLRGHGQSEGPRGHAPSYEHLMDDIEILLHYTQTEFPRLPLFLYGHSLGGNLVLNFALRRSFELNGVIATSPWLHLAFEPAKVKITLARLMNTLWPNFSQENGLDVKQLSRNEQVVKSYSDDPLVHSAISARLFHEVFEAGYWALENAFCFPYPLLLMHGSADQITSWKASQEFAKRAPMHCTFKLWEGAYHELHHEPEADAVLQVILKWIEGHCEA